MSRRKTQWRHKLLFMLISVVGGEDKDEAERTRNQGGRQI